MRQVKAKPDRIDPSLRAEGEAIQNASKDWIASSLRSSQ
jgi:hypothetical protein